MEVLGNARKFFIESWEATKNLRILSEDQLKSPLSEGIKAIQEVKPTIQTIPGSARAVFKWTRIEGFDLRKTLGLSIMVLDEEGLYPINVNKDVGLQESPIPFTGHMVEGL